MVEEIKSEQELKEMLKKIPYKDDEHRNRIVCSLIGHSRISEICMGYRNCARCGALLGDSLGSMDMGRPDAVIVGHNCMDCKANYEECTWKDKVFVKNPFTKE